MEKIKLIIYAILIGFFLANLIMVLEYASGLFPSISFEVCVLSVTVVANILLYPVFVRKRQTRYALICIPSMLITMLLCIDFWAKAFGDTSIYAMAGTYILFVSSMFTSICVFVAMMLVRKLIAKRNERKNM